MDIKRVIYLCVVIAALTLLGRATCRRPTDACLDAKPDSQNPHRFSDESEVKSIARADRKVRLPLETTDRNYLSRRDIANGRANSQRRNPKPRLRHKSVNQRSLESHS